MLIQLANLFQSRTLSIPTLMALRNTSKKKKKVNIFTFFFIVAFKQARPENSDREIFTSFILYLFPALSLTAVPCKNLTRRPGQELESEADPR